MTAIEDFLAFLEFNNLGVIADNIFMNSFTNTPDNIITVNLGVGYSPPKGMKDVYQHFTIFIRNVSQKDALSISSSIFNLLMDGDKRIECPSSRILLIRNIQSPYFLDTDDKCRTTYMISIDVLADSF